MPNKKHKKIFIIIPVFNEEKNIKSVSEKCLNLNYNTIIINDGSTDKTEKIILSIKNPKLFYLKHKTNLGKGAAMKTACLAAKKLKADIVVLLDGDNQHDPNDIKKLIKPLLKNKADIIFGTRDFNKSMPLIKKIGNTILSFIIKIISGLNIKDTQCGFKAFTTNAFDKIIWNSTDYSVETEIIIKTKKNNLKYKTRKIKTIYQDNYKGTTFLDGFKILFNIIKIKTKCYLEYKL